MCGKFCSSLHSSHTGEGVPAAKHWGNRLCGVEESPICCQLQTMGGIGCLGWKIVPFAVSCKAWEGDRLCGVEASPLCCQLQSMGGIGGVELKRVLFAVSCKVWGE